MVEIGKENDIRDSDDRSSECGIPVRKDQGPPFQRVFIIVRYASFKSTLLLYSTLQYGDILFKSEEQILWCYYSEETSLEKFCIVDSFFL